MPGSTGTQKLLKPPLTDLELTQVQANLAITGDTGEELDTEEVLAEMFNITVRRRDMATLRPSECLNDEKVNLYMKVLQYRETIVGRLPGQPSFFCFTSQFYRRIWEHALPYAYADVARWTRNIDIFSYDRVLVPIHLPGHWTLVVINFYHRRFEYYDSLGGSPGNIMHNLWVWLLDEATTKGGLRRHGLTGGWPDVCAHSNSPPQKNDFDCGVYVCKTNDYICRDGMLDLSQKDMPYMRHSLVNELLLWAPPVRVRMPIRVCVRAWVSSCVWAQSFARMLHVNPNPKPNPKQVAKEQAAAAKKKADAEAAAATAAKKKEEAAAAAAAKADKKKEEAAAAAAAKADKKKEEAAAVAAAKAAKKKEDAAAAKAVKPTCVCVRACLPMCLCACAPVRVCASTLTLSQTLSRWPQSRPQRPRRRPTRRQLRRQRRRRR
jgi:hypothetical protein